MSDDPRSRVRLDDPRREAENATRAGRYSRLLGDLDEILRLLRGRLADANDRGEFDARTTELLLTALDLEARVCGLDKRPR